MIIDLKQLFTGKAEELEIDCALDFSSFEYQSNHPFLEPVRVRGKITAGANFLLLDAAADFIHHCACDRCLAQIKRPVQVRILHDLVSSLTEGDDSQVLIEGDKLDLGELVLEDLILNLPTKNLCREDCAGICHECGKDLNKGGCGCRADRVDPRFEILRQLTDKTD